MPVNIRIKDHMLMPFGCPKWEINQIQITGVSTDGTYFTSNTKCVHIDKASNTPLRLTEFPSYFPDKPNSFPEIEDPQEALTFAFDFLANNCELQTESEHRFLNLYKKFLLDSLWDIDGYWRVVDKPDDDAEVKKFPDRLFYALMPFPQAHIYVRDPFSFSSAFNFAPDRMKKVDFAFWTGEQLVAIEIDGGSHIGNSDHVTKDRMLARAGVHVIHILNDELEQYGLTVISELLPSEITYFWKDLKYNGQLNPFYIDIPF